MSKVGVELSNPHAVRTVEASKNRFGTPVHPWGSSSRAACERLRRAEISRVQSSSGAQNWAARRQYPGPVRMRRPRSFVAVHAPLLREEFGRAAPETAAHRPNVKEVVWPQRCSRTEPRASRTRPPRRDNTVRPQNRARRGRCATCAACPPRRAGRARDKHTSHTTRPPHAPAEAAPHRETPRRPAR